MVVVGADGNILLIDVESKENKNIVKEANVLYMFHFLLIHFI
jgi:hypothetical protein